MKRVDLRTIRRMDFMIQHKCTGSPEEFARTLELSRATFFEYLAYMRHELGVDIQYNRYKSTYHYPNGGLYTALGFRESGVRKRTQLSDNGHPSKRL